MNSTATTTAMRNKCEGSGPVVMVDDDEDDRSISKYCFTKSKLRSKYQFIEFSSGESFVNHLVEKVANGTEPMPSLVLLDINMPIMNGFDVLKTVRTNPNFVNVPVMMIFSNSQNPTDMQKAQDLGADHYCVKPFNTNEFIRFFDGLSS